MSVPSPARSCKSTAIPTRFPDADIQFLAELAAETGLPRSELIRRGVRVLRLLRQRGEGMGFLLELPS